MRTDPLESILHRTLSVAQAAPIIEVASPLLQELSNFGSNALIRCATSTKGGENEDVAAMSLYRHILEMTDATEVLLSSSCAYPAIPLIRSSFEALISLDYILKDGMTYVTRSLSWLVGYVNQRIQMYELLDPSTVRGQSFEQAISTDYLVQPIPLPPKADIDSAIANLRSLLASPQFAAIDQDFQNLQQPKVWYRLYGGPNNLHDLAHRVGRAALYDFLYRHWSRVAHAQDFGPFITATSSGRTTIRPIRDPSEMKNSANFAATIFLVATIAMLNKFRPGEDFSTWYERDVRQRYVQIFRRA